MRVNVNDCILGWCWWSYYGRGKLSCASSILPDNQQTNWENSRMV